MGTTAVAVVAPFALVGLIVVVVAIRPSAAAAITQVLQALAGVLISIYPFSSVVRAPLVRAERTAESRSAVEEANSSTRP